MTSSAICPNTKNTAVNNFFEGWGEGESYIVTVCQALNIEIDVSAKSWRSLEETVQTARNDEKAKEIYRRNVAFFQDWVFPVQYAVCYWTIAATYRANRWSLTSHECLFERLEVVEMSRQAITIMAQTTIKLSPVAITMIEEQNRNSPVLYCTTSRRPVGCHSAKVALQTTIAAQMRKI